jgi:hypothetical protein
MSLPGAFQDPKVPKGFAPFGIQALGGNIFVTYAKQDAAAKDDVAAPGRGYVDAFTPDGQLVGQVVNSQKKNAPLNAAWGLALAPAGFGNFAGDLLGTPIEIPGLWAIAFGNGAASGPPNTLYFLSGPVGEKHGLFGSITAG